MQADRGQWASRMGFVLAAAGSAVGLGNIWRFPFITGENGGGWFVLLYLLCVALVGLPIMTAEIMIGRAAQRQPVVAFETLQGGRTAWAGVGWLGVIAGFLILSYYVVVAGWAMDYTLKSVVSFSRPMHEQAEVEATRYRATTDLPEMRVTLARRQGDRDAAPVISRLRNSVPPSVWRAYDEFTAALTQAGADDVARLEAVHAVWGRSPDAMIDAAGVAELLEVDVTNARRQSWQTVRDRLFDKPGFQAKVEQAEALLADIEAARHTALEAAGAHYQALDPAALRQEAEDLFRRTALRERVQEAFGAVAGDGWTTLFWTAIFMGLTILIVAGGVSSGIERACGILMPALFVLLLVLVIYGMFQSGFPDAMAFVFKPDATKIHPSSVLQAMGQSFFSLSLGMGAMITYGSYQKTKDQLVGQAATIAGLDTAVALLACLMIFPIVFSFGQEPSAGPGLVFMSMPLAFAEMGAGGLLLSTTFFGLLVFAALTSSISLLEVVASYFIDERGWSRKAAVWSLGGLIFLLAIPSAFAGDGDFLMTGWLASYGSDFLSTMDFLASNWMLPIGGFLIAIYAGWVMPRRLRNAELEGTTPALITGWLLLVRFIAPAMVIVVLLQSIGLLDADELLHGLFH